MEQEYEVPGVVRVVGLLMLALVIGIGVTTHFVNSSTWVTVVVTMVATIAAAIVLSLFAFLVYFIAACEQMSEDDGHNDYE